MASDLILHRPEGLYCPAGGFYIDPWRKVDRAVITHAHADHARSGHAHYLAAAPAEHVLKARLGAIDLQTLPYGEAVSVNGVRLSLHPAGHVLGSAQVRLEHQGQVWVASGDYRPTPAGAEPDRTCTPFEPVRCHTFITESTFGLPVYRWRPDGEVFAEMAAWWQANAALNRASVVLAYSFGKAQRLLAGVAAVFGAGGGGASGVSEGLPGPLVCHGAAQNLNHAYRATGVALPPTQLPSEVTDKAALRRALVVAPPAVGGGTWLRQFGAEAQVAFASGWMQLRGNRRRGGYDRGFVLSDHADWPGLVGAIGATGAERVIVTHGAEAVMVRWLQGQGLQAGSFATEYGHEEPEV
jgi:putative mRNA 3-end processing factor